MSYVVGVRLLQSQFQVKLNFVKISVVLTKIDLDRRNEVVVRHWAAFGESKWVVANFPLLLDISPIFAMELLKISLAYRALLSVFATMVAVLLRDKRFDFVNCVLGEAHCCPATMHGVRSDFVISENGVFA